MTMTARVQDVLQAHPEIAFFLVLGLGHLLGKIALGSFKLGAVTGTLLAGVIVGQLGITLPDEVKQCFFLLFLFAIGFRTGPQFFRGLRSDGLSHAALAAMVASVGLLVAYAVSRVFGYDPGTAAGLVAGALTESAAIGTAMDAISKLPATQGERTAMANNIPVAFAVTYLIGMTAAAWILSQLGPKLLRVNLADECRKLEDQMQGDTSAPLVRRQEFELRAYAEVDNTNFQSPTAYHKGQYASVNLLTYPVDNLMIGAELLWGERENNDDTSGEDTRFQFSIKYDFGIKL